MTRRALLTVLVLLALPASAHAATAWVTVGSFRPMSIDPATGRRSEPIDVGGSMLVTPDNKTVYVHAGTYRPPAKGQALVWFNARHDGITLEAVGDVTLTAANPEVAEAEAHSYPAVVNHVVYFGDGVSRKTVFRGFKITGARNFTTGSGEKSPIESDDIRKTPFFYADGGGIIPLNSTQPLGTSVYDVANLTDPNSTFKLREPRSEG